MPKNWTATRIENRSGGGIPDLHIMANGLPFWVELKTTKGTRVSVRPHQIAWHSSYNRKLGLSFFLIKHLGTRHITVVRGSQAIDLAEKPLSEVQGSRFEALGPLFSKIENCVWDHYHGIVVERRR